MFSRTRGGSLHAKFKLEALKLIAACRMRRPGKPCCHPHNYAAGRRRLRTIRRKLCLGQVR